MYGGGGAIPSPRCHLRGLSEGNERHASEKTMAHPCHLATLKIAAVFLNERQRTARRVTANG